MCRLNLQIFVCLTYTLNSNEIYYYIIILLEIQYHVEAEDYIVFQTTVERSKSSKHDLRYQQTDNIIVRPMIYS